MDVPGSTLARPARDKGAEVDTGPPNNCDSVGAMIVSTDDTESVAASQLTNPWPVLCATVLGFFLVVLDSGIIAVANPTIMVKLNTSYDLVIWATSAYLLAFAVPLLLAGSLGDRYGQKNVYVIGLFLFAAASLGCGLAASIQMLIAARVAQGVGAALITPQTLALITRVFPPDRRGAATGVWGAVAGLGAMLGPVAGGLLVDRFGWQSIFFVNVPLGFLGLGLAIRFIPQLPTDDQAPDFLGAALSGIGMFLAVFGLQEAQEHHWSWHIWMMISAGLVAFVAFIYWEAITTRDPLVPVAIFRDRNFSLSTLCNGCMAFIAVALPLPVVFYLQSVLGLTAARAAIVSMSISVALTVASPIAGKVIDKVSPRPVIGFALGLLAVGTAWLSIEMKPTTPTWQLVLPMLAIGMGIGFAWSPLATTAIRELPARLVGAGSGVYNAGRQIGYVLGSASMAAFLTRRIGAEIPGMADRDIYHHGPTVQLPSVLQHGFAAAMSQSMDLVTAVALLGMVAAVFLVRPTRTNIRSAPGTEPNALVAA